MPVKPILVYRPAGGTPLTSTPALHSTIGPSEPELDSPILNYIPEGGLPVPPWPPFPTDLTYPECGMIQLVSGQSWIDVTFANTKPDTEWIFEDLQVVNTTDPTPFNIWPGIVTEKTITGFRIQLNGLPNTDNYFLHWAVGGCATSDWVVSSGVETTNFLQLTDTPNEYVGQAGKGVKVNTAEDGLEFGVVASSGGDGAGVYNVLDYGAVADCVTLFDITMPNGNVVTSAGHTFVDADIGKWVIIRGATGGGVSPLLGKITAVSGHTATLDATTTTALTNLHGATSYPRMDFGTDNTIPFLLACLAVPGPGNRNYYLGTPYASAGTMNPVLPGDGGTVYIPRGNYLMVPIYPAGTGTSFWFLMTNNITIKGDGMGQTVIYTTSAGTSGPTLWGGYGSSLCQNWLICDFTLYDLNYFNGNGNTLNIRMVDNCRIERIEINNSRGNGSINYQGYATGGLPLNKRVWIKDCWIHGNQVDSYAPGIANGIEGDGFNVGEVADVHIENNRVESPGRHAYEGGGNCADQYFIGNTIDMGNVGLSGINPTGGSTTVVAGNTIRNVYAGGFGIDFTVDSGVAYVANDIRCIGNYVHGNMQAAFRFQNSSGDVTNPDHVDRIIVANNQVQGDTNVSTVGILIGGYAGTPQSMQMLVTGNWFNNLGFGLGTVDGLGSATGKYVVVKNNVFAASGGQPAVDAIAANGHAIIEDNVLLGTPINRYGSKGMSCNIDGNNVLAGAIYSNTATGLAYNITDQVEIVRGSSMAPQLIVWGVVSNPAGVNTVTTYAYNPTGGTLNTGASTTYIVHRRLP